MLSFSAANNGSHPNEFWYRSEQVYIHLTLVEAPSHSNGTSSTYRMAIAHQWSPSYSEGRRTKYTVRLIVRRLCKRSAAEREPFQSWQYGNHDVVSNKTMILHLFELCLPSHTQLGPFWATLIVHINHVGTIKGLGVSLISRLLFGSFIAISVLGLADRKRCDVRLEPSFN